MILCHSSSKGMSRCFLSTFTAPRVGPKRPGRQKVRLTMSIVPYIFVNHKSCLFKYSPIRRLAKFSLDLPVAVDKLLQTLFPVNVRQLPVSARAPVLRLSVVVSPPRPRSFGSPSSSQCTWSRRRPTARRTTCSPRPRSRRATRAASSTSTTACRPPPSGGPPRRPRCRTRVAFSTS